MCDYRYFFIGGILAVCYSVFLILCNRSLNIRKVLITCSWKDSFGIDCLTCGFQRSFALLLKGEILESIQLFPATIPLLVTFLLLFTHLIFKFKRGASMILGSFIVAAVLIISNYIHHIIDGSFLHV